MAIYFHSVLNGMAAHSQAERERIGIQHLQMFEDIIGRRVYVEGAGLNLAANVENNSVLHILHRYESYYTCVLVIFSHIPHLLAFILRIKPQLIRNTTITNSIK